MQEIKILGVKIKFNFRNVKIIDSYKVEDEETMRKILRLFRSSILYYNCFSKRSIDSWVKEWKTHNRLYKWGILKKHTKNCDLEENEKLHRLIMYQILGR